jgi:cell division protein FtsZ
MEKMNQHVFKIFGLGGCGNNAVAHMIRSGFKGADYVAAHSNIRFLSRCPNAATKIQVGVKAAKGGGCGGRIDKGRECVEENLPEIMSALAGSDLVFLTAGLGAGTGSGGLPVVAKALSLLEKPPLVVAVVTMPFAHEDFRMPLAQEALNELHCHCNSVISIDNAKIDLLDPDLPFLENKKKSDEILIRAVTSIIELVDVPGEINIDFADVSAVLEYPGPALITFGEARGKNRAVEALKEAVANPLMSETSLIGARAVICNITADSGILVQEVTDVNHQIHKVIGSGAKLFFGLVIDESLKDSGTLRVTILASGLGQMVYTGQEVTFFDQLPLETMTVDMETGGDTPENAPKSKLLEEIESHKRPVLEIVAPIKKEVPVLNMEPGPYSAISRRPIRPQLDHYQGQSVSNYEEGAGVDSVNQNPGLYNQPRFIRKPAD